MVVAGKRRIFSVADYYEMGRAGILTEDDRVELIEGEIIDMSPIGSWHSHCVTVLSETLIFGLRRRARLVIQNPLRLDNNTEPQPDIVIVKQGDYRREYPRAGDALLVIEVSDSSLAYDREVKLRLYARFGIPEVWIVNIRDRRIESYHRPEGGEYDEIRVVPEGGTIAPTTFPDVAVSVGDIFSD